MEEKTLIRINEELDSIEKAENATIIYACESGSRAWGFESEDSDYDVRFIYLRKTPWYLSVRKKRDVIERPISDELDISGWDLSKALYLLKRSNPPLLEWLQSPIVYRENASAVSKIRAVMPEYYSPMACMYHYLHMARSNFREYMKGDVVWTKKYFYALRPLLACIWIESGYGIVPTEFEKLVERTVENRELKRAIEKLLARKMAGKERDCGVRIPIISDFLEKHIDGLSADNEPTAQNIGYEKLDHAFIEILKEVNGATI